jgi:hypothetical protein
MSDKEVVNKDPRPEAPNKKGATLDELAQLMKEEVGSIGVLSRNYLEARDALKEFASV